MPPRLALLLTVIFVLWLFVTDSRRRAGFSRRLWAPFLWILILGSRPVATWFSGSSEGLEDASNTNLNRIVFLGLIFAGIVILSRTQIVYSQVISKSKLFFAYFLYVGFSSIWSEAPITSINQWIKDFGNVIMALIILSENDPGEAVNATLTRCSYILVPFSFLVAKYYPEIGRTYNRWTYEPIVLGVTQDKNYLGAMLMVTGTILVWGLLDRRNLKANFGKWDLINYVILMMMLVWLLVMANSATSLFCIIVGSAILFVLKWPFVRDSLVRLNLGHVAVVLGFLFLFQIAFGFGELVTLALGRDMTFTGRTEIWERCLKVPINPLIGTGYCSFWLGNKSEAVSDGFYYRLMEAHDGYLETYLNLGLIGLGMLIMLLFSGINRAKEALWSGSSFASFRVAFMMVVLLYNVTESAFNGINLIWFTMLLVVLEVPGRNDNLLFEITDEEAESEFDEPKLA